MKIRRILLLLVLGLVFWAGGGGYGAWAGVPIPDLDIGQGGHCVADPLYMRLNHMNLLIHQRDQTVRQGIRGGPYSLAVCVDCHASKVNHSVLGTSRNFCQGCHEYVSVRIDCFECHSSEPRNTKAMITGQSRVVKESLK
ncbi:MAG: hypothetical protein G3I09_06160 [Ferrovum sp.]|nr:hypothetical protein [Ferrovum sp.]